MFSLTHKSRSLSNIGKGLFTKRSFASLPIGEVGNFSVKTTTVPPTAPVSKITQLSNGLKVATFQTSNNTGVAVGLYVKTGTRNETHESFGASYYMKRMGFQSTNTRTSLRLAREIENLGATYSVASGREHTVYASETTPDKLSAIVPILSDVANPALLDWEVRDEMKNIDFESHQLESDARTLVFEILHQEAYRNKGLGNPLLPLTHNVHNMTSDILTQYVMDNYTSDRFAVIASGNVEHEAFVKLVQSNFGSFKGKTGEKAKADKPEFIGGDVRIATEGDTHFAIAYEGAKVGDKDAYAFGTLQFLLGGANSDTVDAIGNGASSKLFRAVGGDQQWVKEVSAFNVNYSDSGLFGIYAIAEPGHASKLAKGVTGGIKSVLQSIDEASLLAAKKRYKADLYAQTDSRTGAMDFLAVQALNSEKVDGVEAAVQAVESVTLADLKRVAQKVFSQKPTVVAIGDVANISPAEVIQKHLA